MNTDAKRLYAQLGLRPGCSDEDIRSAFRRRAKELHPDAESGDATAFIRLKRAYDTLGDPATRANYDRACIARARRAVRPAAELPLPPRPRTHRPGGMSFARYFVAFVFMGGLSFGAIEWMISDETVARAGDSHPATLLTRETAKDDSKLGARAADAQPSGFWDPSSRDGTPRGTAFDSGGSSRNRSGGIGSLSSE